MTTVLDIQGAVHQITGDEDGVLFTDAHILRFINFGITEIVRRTRCIQNAVVGNNATLSALDIYGGVQLPADFISEIDVYYGTSPNLTRLARMPYSQLVAEAMQPSSSSPSGYSITDYIATQTGRLLLFYPAMTPGLTNQNYRITYVAQPAALTASGNTIPTPTFLDDALTWYCMRMCKLQENDFQLAAEFQKMYEDKIRQSASEFSDHGELDNYTIRDELQPVYHIWE